MNRLLVFFFLALLYVPIHAQEPEATNGTPEQAAQSGFFEKLLKSLEGDSSKGPELELDQFLKLKNPPISLGNTGDRVRELQATLNKRLIDYQEHQLDKFIPFKVEVMVGELQPDYERDPKLKVRIVYDPYEQFKAFQVRGDWVPTDRFGNSVDSKAETREPFTEAWGIKLPPEPLKVDGVYGQRTYAAVMLFQKIQNLPTTGEVDAVTLDKLEPMVPTNRMLATIMNWVTGGLEWNSPPENYAWVVKTKTAFYMTLIILIAAAVVYQIARSMVQSTRFLSRWLFTPSTSPWFNTMREKQVFLRAAQFAPAVFTYCAAIAIFPAPQPDHSFPYLDVFQDWHAFVSRLGLAYAALVFVLVSLAFADACEAIFSHDQETDNPISGIIRASKRIVTLLGILLIIAALAGESPWRILGGLGAFTAVILLVFRDYLLGLVASVQIIANNLVRIGDWVEMPKYGANGDVTAISLNVIKVQNADKTISTIPTHSLLTESFRNWSGMLCAGGRRIKRAINIDVHSIQVCTPEMIDHFKGIELIRDYVNGKLEELDEYNAKHDTKASAVNSRRLTNIGTFRAYLEAYLKQHQGLSGEFTFLVRHLQPTKTGLPIEIYAYCKETNWKEYEAVQADIFDHILAILPEFGLSAFQEITEIGALPEAHSPSEELKRKFGKARQFVDKQNAYLTDHPRSSVNAALRRVKNTLAELGIDSDATVEPSGRRLLLSTRNGPA